MTLYIKEKEMDFKEIRKNFTQAKIKRFAESLYEDYTKAVAEGRKIICFTDYDTDGICSGVQVKEMFPEAEIVSSDRFKNGYGITKDYDIPEGALIIATDVGSGDASILKSIIEKAGTKPYIIDHHIIDKGVAKLDKDGEIHLLNFTDRKANEYCAGGLTYEVFCAIDEQHPYPNDIRNTNALLGGIATISDVVCLGEGNERNVEIVRHALDLIHYQPQEGEQVFTNAITAMLYKIGESKYDVMNKKDPSVILLENEYVGSKDISFTIAPAFNAMSRVMGSGNPVIEALSNTDENWKNQFNRIGEITRVNEIRKEDLSKFKDSKEYKNFVEQIKANGDHIAILITDDIGRGYTGLVCSDLVNSLGIPALVFAKQCNSETGEIYYVGSGRNADGFPSLYDTCHSIMSKYGEFGGHANACGFTIEGDSVDKLDALAKKLQKVYSEIVPEELPSRTDFVDLDKITKQDILDGEPYGNGRPFPYGKCTVTLTKDNTNMKLSGNYVSIELPNGIKAFGNIKDVVEIGKTYEIEGTLCISHFKGEEKIQLDIVKVDIERELTKEARKSVRQTDSLVVSTLEPKQNNTKSVVEQR